MKRIVIASVVCLLMVAGLSQCTCSKVPSVPAGVGYTLDAVSEYSGVTIDTVLVLQQSLSTPRKIPLPWLLPIRFDKSEKIRFGLYCKKKLIYDTGLLVRKSLFLEPDTLIRLLFRFRADSTLAVEQQLLTTTPQQSPVAVF